MAADALSVSDSDSTASGPLDVQKDDGWEDLEDDQIQDTIVSLFDNETFLSATEMFRYCKQKYEFDVWELQRRYGMIYRLVLKISWSDRTDGPR